MTTKKSTVKTYMIGDEQFALQYFKNRAKQETNKKEKKELEKVIVILEQEVAQKHLSSVSAPLDDSL